MTGFTVPTRPRLLTHYRRRFAIRCLGRGVGVAAGCGRDVIYLRCVRFGSRGCVLTRPKHLLGRKPPSIAEDHNYDQWTCQLGSLQKWLAFHSGVDVDITEGTIGQRPRSNLKVRVSVSDPRRSPAQVPSKIMIPETGCAQFSIPPAHPISEICRHQAVKWVTGFNLRQFARDVSSRPFRDRNACQMDPPLRNDARAADFQVALNQDGNPAVSLTCFTFLRHA